MKVLVEKGSRAKLTLPLYLSPTNHLKKISINSGRSMYVADSWIGEVCDHYNLLAHSLHFDEESCNVFICLENINS